MQPISGINSMCKSGKQLRPNPINDPPVLSELAEVGSSSQTNSASQHLQQTSNHQNPWRLANVFVFLVLDLSAAVLGRFF